MIPLSRLLLCAALAVGSAHAVADEKLTLKLDLMDRSQREQTPAGPGIPLTLTNASGESREVVTDEKSQIEISDSHFVRAGEAFSVSFRFSDWKPMKWDLTLERDAITTVTVGLYLGISLNIHFETGKWDIDFNDPNTQEALDALVELAKFAQGRRILIEGHTDSRPVAIGNEALSRNRANALREYLVRMGFDPARIVARGLGARQPRASNSNAGGMAVNRRIEARVQ